MRDFIIDPRLQADSKLLGQLPLSQVRLMDNALFPWLILVPCVTQSEIHQLARQQQIQLLDEITAISRFLEDNFNIDKINVGAIGNIVRQLHVHIVGRSEDDYCWPNVVWGVEERKSYTQQQITVIADQLANYLRQQAKLDVTTQLTLNFVQSLSEVLIYTYKLRAFALLLNKLEGNLNSYRFR